MRAFLAFCLFLSAFAFTNGNPPIAVAQTRQGQSQVDLELGAVRVWLGMPETDAVAAFKRAGYTVIGEVHSGAGIMVVSDKTSYPVSFKEGRVAFAAREWVSSSSDRLGEVIKALSALASHGANSCSILHDPISNPDNSVDRVFINCGERSMLLATGKFSSLGEKPYVTIEERIGEPQ